MDKKECAVVFAAVAHMLGSTSELPNLKDMSHQTADAIYEQFATFTTIDRLSVATVLGMIGVVDSRACSLAYVSGVPSSDLEAAALNALSYLIAADRIFTEEGVGKTLEDHFAEGATEGL
jgi:hypothetical protein